MLRPRKYLRAAAIVALLVTIALVGCIDIPPPPIAADVGPTLDTDGGIDVPVQAACESTCGTYCVDDECVGVLTFEGHADHLCAKMTDEQVYCWGRADQGALGDHGNTPALTPTRMDVAAGAVMSAGVSHTCWLASGEVRCTGDNTLFQSGHGQPDEDVKALNRVPMPPDDPAEQLACGGHSSCVITASGAPLCWGRDLDGQGWDGGSQNGTGHLDPQILNGWNGDRALSIAVGAYVVCVRFKEGVHCIGNGSAGALGRGSIEDSDVLVPVAGLGTIDSLRTSYHHFCALSDGGTRIECWGQNSYGQVSGLPGAEFELGPVDVSDWFDRPLRAVYPGWRATCVEDIDGQLSCWGLNNNGILAVPGPGLVVAPIALPELRGTSFFSGSRACLADKTAVYCWGANSLGQIGTGFLGPSVIAAPTALAFPPN